VAVKDNPESPANGDGTPPAGAVQTPVPPALPPSAAPQSPAPFGGYKGGRKTKSGFPVDSKEHAAWVLEQERLRSERRRNAVKILAIPPALPPRPVAGAGGVPPVLPATGPGGGATTPAPGLPAGAVPVSTAGAGGVMAGVMQWSRGMLQKPAALVVRIVDRFRKIQLNRKLDRLGLTPPELAEVKRDLEWHDKARSDFEDSLAEVSALGLNKSGVSAEYAPYVNVVLCGGELVLAHMAALDRLEKMYHLKLETLKKQQDENSKPAKA